MNTLKVVYDKGHKIVLQLQDVGDWKTAEFLAGHVEDLGPGTFRYAFSIQNMTKIFQTFTGGKKPVVIEGQKEIDKLREKHVLYNKWRTDMLEVMSMERYPVEPNGKFVPYAHQTKIIGSTMKHPVVAVYADCGVGKTGSLIRAVEIQLASKDITPGKVLISAPLSILYTSWVDDVKKFSSLRYKVLWTPIANKTILSEEDFVVCNLGPKPDGALTYRKKSASRFVLGSVMKPKINDLDRAEGVWTKCEVTFRVASMPDGSKIEYGEVRARQAEKENTKELYIQECLKDPDVDVFIINHDGVRIYEDILKKHEFEWVIVDESTKIKSIQSQVTQSHIDISWNAKRRTVLSGTPNPNGFMDLWSQFYFLDRGLTLGTRIADYRNEYFVPVKVGRFGGNDAVKWNIRSVADRDRLIEHVHKTSIFIDQRDCVDLPPRTDMRRHIMLTPEQSKAYRDMEDNLSAEILHPKTGLNIQMEAANLLAKIMRLRQITAGFAVSNDDKIVPFEKNPKLDELVDFIEQLGDKKLVVVCQFKEEIRVVLEKLEKYGVKAIYGDVSVSDRTDSIRSFQSTDDIKVMVLQAQAAAHGITLTEAHYMVFMSLDYNFEYYYQVGKRIERIGQKHPMFVNYFLARTADGQATIDEDLLDILGSKGLERTKLFQGNQDFVETADELSKKILERIQQRR